MSASSESMKAYEAASNKYSELANKYTGENGYNLANSEAQKSAGEVATSAGSTAGTAANAASRSAGMTRGQAAGSAASKAANAAQQSYGNAYSTGMSNAMTANKNAVDAQQNVVSNAASKYNADKSTDTAWITAGGNVLGGLATLSDENEKDVKEDTSDDKKEKLGKSISDAANAFKDAGKLEVNMQALSDENQKNIFDEYLSKLEAL